MAEAIVIAARPRDRAGKGVARSLRREGRIPAVIYGDNKPPELVSLGLTDVLKAYGTGAFLSTLYAIELDGGRTSVLARDIQLDPVTDRPIHVDFLRLAAGATIEVEVVVEFVDHEESAGLKAGGVLNVVRHEIEVSCPATAIPQSITVSLAGLEVGDSVHISGVKLPEGVMPTIQDRDFTIATIAAPTVMVEVEEAEEEVEAEEEEAAAEEGEEA